MKNFFLKCAACLMFAAMFLPAKSQIAQTTPPNSETQTLSPQHLKKANDVTERIATEVKLTDEQKTKLQASMEAAMVTYEAAVRKAKEIADESISSSLKTELVADITARIKAILTAEQFTAVMKKENDEQSAK